MLYNLLEVFLFGLWRHGGDSDDDVHNEDDDGGKTMANNDEKTNEPTKIQHTMITIINHNYTRKGINHNN